MKNNITLKGKVTITDDEGNAVEYDNLFMLRAKEPLIDVLMGNTISISKYAFLSIGADSTPVRSDDVMLGRELFRKPLTTLEKVSSTRLIAECYIEPGEAVFNWRELALFDSSGTWETLGSGLLLNKVIINENKLSGTAKTVSWQIEVI